MKKLYSMIVLTAGMLAATASAEVILTPESNTTYMIEHRSSFYMTKNENALQIMSAGMGNSQKFTFVPVEGAEGTYNIQCSDGTYIGSDNGWTVIFLEDATDPYAQFTFEEGHEDGYITIHNVGRNGYLGTDSNADGSYIYTNKEGKDGKELWKLIKADIESVLNEAQALLDRAKGTEAFPAEAEATLQAAIDKAKSAEPGNETEAGDELRTIVSAMSALYDTLTEAITLRDTATIGEQIGCCTAEVKEALETSISEAMKAWATENPTSMREASETLEQAISAYNDSIFTFVSIPGKKYYFINTIAGLAMSIINNEVALSEYTGANNQLYELIPVEGQTNYFNFKIDDGSGYVARKDSWNTTVLTDPEDNQTKIGFYVYDLEDKTYFLGFNKNDYLGLDGTSEGDLVYSNKKTWEEKSRWQVFEADQTAVDELIQTEANIRINTLKGKIIISGVAEDASINIYTVDGKIAASGKPAGGVCEMELPSGCYAARIMSAEIYTAKLVIIK